MSSLYDSIRKASVALQSLTSTALTHEQLESTLSILESIDIGTLLQGYSKELPAQPGVEDNKDVYRKVMQDTADELNKRITPLLEALDRIKKIRKTLDLPALDPIIQAGQKIIRPLFNFTSSMQE